ncbi:hypothetical protein MHO82_14650 [Vibrio sp. Of7-15]|uniref:hypothetical protein n=1 Tax=Vibrio sp. Of7-15 TaxID=2724879 RepID=UPI001EF33D7B|nr:hypothetical protein [Vibrio sp. Of7-15]MCG7498107.1 hypothetical protein [Vibrio sp. Of7-15]
MTIIGVEIKTLSLVRGVALGYSVLFIMLLGLSVEHLTHSPLYLVLMISAFMMVYLMIHGVNDPIQNWRHTLILLVGSLMAGGFSFLFLTLTGHLV